MHEDNGNQPLSQEEYHTTQEIYGLSTEQQSEMTYDIDSNQHMMPDEEAHGLNKHDVQLMMNDD